MSTDYGQETTLMSALRKLAAAKAAYTPGPSLTQRNYGLGSGLNPALGKQPLQGPQKPAAAPQMPQGNISNQDVRKHFSGYKGPASFGVPAHVIESMRQADRTNGGKGEITWSSDNVPMIPGLAANDPRNDPRTYAQQPTVPAPQATPTPAASPAPQVAPTPTSAPSSGLASDFTGGPGSRQDPYEPDAERDKLAPARADFTAPIEAPQPNAAEGFAGAMGGAADDVLGTIGGMALNNFGALSAIGKAAPQFGDAGKAMVSGMQLRQAKPLSWPKTGMLKKAVGLGALARMGLTGARKALPAVAAATGVASLGKSVYDDPETFKAGLGEIGNYLGPKANAVADTALATPGVVVNGVQDAVSQGLGLLSPNKGAKPAGAPTAKPTALDAVKKPDGSSLLGDFPIPVRDSFANMAATKGPEPVRSALQAQADVTPELGYDKQQYDRKLYNMLAPLLGKGKWDAEKPAGAVDPKALAESTLHRVDNPLGSTANDYLQAAYNNPYAAGAAGVGALGLGGLLASGRKAPEEEEEAPAPRKRKKRKPAAKTAAKDDPTPYFGFAAAGVGALGLADTLHKKMRRKKKVKEESPETEEYVIERKVAALLG